MLKIFEFILRTKAASSDLVEITPPAPPISNFEGTGIEGLIARIGGWILELAAGLLVIAIIYSAIMYITSGGDESKAENAKKNLLWAVIGLVIMILLYIIIQWVQDIF